MTTRLIGGAAAVFITLLMTPAFGQTAPSSASAVAQAAQAQAPSDDARPARRARKKADKKSGKEPSAGQMAARERQKKCAAEWKTAKEAGKVEAGMKWPKFWSQCNTRLKGEKA